MKNLKQFIWEEMNLIQVSKAFAQWIQIGMLFLIFLLLKEIIYLLKLIALTLNSLW